MTIAAKIERDDFGDFDRRDVNTEIEPGIRNEDAHVVGRTTDNQESERSEGSCLNPATSTQSGAIV